MELCPCGSSKNYSECCGLFIQGTSLPPTPEALMRSRYTAYSQANIGYIIKTMKGKASKYFNAVDALKWTRKCNWLGLTIISAPQPNENDKKGFVEFIAEYGLNGKKQSLHEISEFRYEKGVWYYIKGNSK